MRWMILTVVVLFLANQSFGDEFMKGVSWYGSASPNLAEMQELGVSFVRPYILWKEVEPKVLDATLTVAKIDADPELVSNYPVIWAKIDERIDALVNGGFQLIVWVGQGFTSDALPLQVNGKIATPDNLGKDYYLGCLYRHVRAVVRRYKDRVHYWQIEGELNEAPLAVLFGVREDSAWKDEEFLTALIKTLRKAVKEEDNSAEITTSFHTDIHPNIHHDFRPSTSLTGSELTGPYDWTEWLTRWAPDLDIIAIGGYPNYYLADPIYGTEIGKRVRMAKETVPDKQVVVLETSYPTPAPGVTLPDPADFTEEKQAEYVRSAISSALENGASGYFHFTFQSKGVTGGYTQRDLEALGTLGVAFHNGDVETLIDFLLSDPEYCLTQLLPVLNAVEAGWGLVRADGTKRPAFYTLQRTFSSIPSLNKTFSLALAKGWNLISLPLAPLNKNVSAVLAPIEGLYRSVWTYNTFTEWERYIVGGPALLNNLKIIEPGKGYWIEMVNPATLAITGTDIDLPIPLKQGWNLIGYNCLTARSVEDALSSIAGNYSSVWTYDAQDGEWKRYIIDRPNFLNNLTILEASRGYWIEAAEDCDVR